MASVLGEGLIAQQLVRYFCSKQNLRKEGRKGLFGLTAGEQRRHGRTRQLVSVCL